MVDRFGMMCRRSLLCTALGALASPGLAEATQGTAGPRSAKFDFLFGRWSVTHRKLRRRLAGSSEWHAFPGTLEVAPILGGLGNFDVNRLDDPAGPYEAHSLRLYNPAAGHWSIWWLDARVPAIDAPVVGGFTGAKGSFFSDETFDGRPIKVRTTYAPFGPDAAQWTQAFLAEGGGSWEVNWIMDFRRAP